MTEFSSFDRTNLQALRVDLAILLAKYGVPSNIEFSIGTMKFSHSEVEMKLSAKIKGATSIDDIVLESRVKALGLVMEKNGCKLVRYDSKKYKMPFIYEKAGKLFKTSEAHAKYLFAA